MTTMTASEASRGFSALLDRIEDGAGPVTITRGKRAVAVVSSAQVSPSPTPSNPLTVRPARRRYQPGLIARVRTARPTGEVLDELRDERL